MCVLERFILIAWFPAGFFFAIWDAVRVFGTTLSGANWLLSRRATDHHIHFQKVSLELQDLMGLK